MSDSIGVDFGTSTMLVSLNSSDQAVVDATIPIGETTVWMPSVVGVNEGGELLYGEEAERLADNRKIYSIKTLLAEDKDSVLIKGFLINIDEAIEQLIGLSLKRAEENAPVEKKSAFNDRYNILLSCPAHWEANPRKRLALIAAKLGIKIQPDQIIDEPIAAGISWVMGSLQTGGQVPNGKTLVFDFGGGTLDVAVLEVDKPNVLNPSGLSEEKKKKLLTPTITVLAAYAITKAGDNVDSIIARYFLSELLGNGAISNSPYSEDEASELLKRSAKRLKEALSDADEASELIPGLTEINLSRALLEQLLEPEVKLIMDFIRPVLIAAAAREKNSNLSAIRNRTTKQLASDIQQILLSGGMSRIPYVRKRLEEELQKPTVIDPYLNDPEKSVAAGLVYPDAVSAINMHRPSCDFFVRYYDKNNSEIKEEAIYKAFTPIHSWQESFINSNPSYKVNLDPPAEAKIMGLVCRRTTGERIDINSKSSIPQILLKVSRGSLTKPNRFVLYLDGRIIFKGARTGKGRIEKWPVMREGLSLQFTPEKHEPKKDWGENIDAFWHGGE